jgi:hypothetical protein
MRIQTQILKMIWILSSNKVTIPTLTKNLALDSQISHPFSNLKWQMSFLMTICKNRCQVRRKCSNRHKQEIGL